MGMLDRFTAKPDQPVTFTVDEPEDPDPRTLLAAYMMRDGYTTEQIEQYLDAPTVAPAAEPVPVDLTPFRNVLAVCHERMRHFGGGVGQTYQQVGSLLETAIAEVEQQGGVR